MALTRRSIETLVDLVENKLSMMDIFDRNDRVEQKLLAETLQELSSLLPAQASRAAATAAFALHR